MQIEAVHCEKVDEKQPLDFISKKKLQRLERRMRSACSRSRTEN